MRSHLPERAVIPRGAPLLFLLLFLAASAIAAVPDGLCILKSRDGGTGRGFIVGNHLFSSAHVFRLANGKIICTQRGRLVDLTPRRTDRVHFHPAFRTSEHSPGAGGQVRDFGGNGMRGARAGITPEYDLGFMELASAEEPILSDFILDPSVTIGQRNEARRAFAEVRRLHENGGHEKFRSANDLFARRIEYLPGRDLFSIYVDESNRRAANIYVDYDLPMRPGDSGSPVARRLPGRAQKFVVVGLVQGTFEEIVVNAQVPHSDVVLPTVISPAVHYATWLKKSRPKLFLAEGSERSSCVDALR